MNPAISSGDAILPTGTWAMMRSRIASGTPASIAVQRDPVPELHPRLRMSTFSS